jgi:predicted RNA-binding Zn-ribbon protein involved in translation (DUF1610 family)
MSSTATSSTDADPIDDGRIADDLACAECGYNLKTIAVSAACPECGMSVVVSARGDRLDGAPRPWLNRLARGAWWLRVSVVLALPIVYLGVALSCYGVWLLTAVQPGRTEPAMDRGYRLAARWATAVGTLLVVSMVLGALVVVAATDQRLLGDWQLRLHAGVSGGFGGDGLPVFDAIFLSGHAVYVLGLLSTWRYLCVLAERVPDGDLASAWCGLGRCWVAAVVGLAGVCGGAYLLVRVGLVPGGWASVWVPMFVSLVILLVLMSLWVATLRVAGRQVEVFRAVAGELKAGRQTISTAVQADKTANQVGKE